MHNFNINIKRTDRKKTVSFQVERGLVKVLVPKHLDKIWFRLSEKPSSYVKNVWKPLTLTNSIELDNSKIKKALDFEFIPLQESIDSVCEFYIKDLE